MKYRITYVAFAKGCTGRKVRGILQHLASQPRQTRSVEHVARRNQFYYVLHRYFNTYLSLYDSIMHRACKCSELIPA